MPTNITANIMSPIMQPIMEGIAADFLPTDITGGNLAIWFDAMDKSTLTFNSTTISSWRNKGTVGGSAAQATAGRQPLYVANAINNKPALQGKWDGVNGSYMTISNPTISYTDFSHFVAFQRVVDTGVAERLCGKYDTAANDREQFFQIFANDLFTMFVDADGAAGTTTVINAPTPTLVVNTPYIGLGKFSPPNAAAGVNRATPTTGTATAVFNGTGNWELFNRVDFGESYAGYIGEELFFTRQLTAAEELQVFQYLSAKWGIAI